MSTLYRIVSNLQISCAVLWNLKNKSPGVFMASLLNIYFRLVLFWTCAIAVAPVLDHKL